jgi:hypothetical protein
MKNRTTILPKTLLFSLIIASNCFAAVSTEEAAKLGNQLTPIGAERSASADGKIPQWQGGLEKNAGVLSADGAPSDPYAAEKPLFIITAENYAKYQENLSPGQVALLKHFPDTYKIPVYPTHRSVGVPEYEKNAAARNAIENSLIGGGNGMANFQGTVAFPIPHDGLEVIWNHITRYRGTSFTATTDTAAPQTNGAYNIATTEQRFTLKDQVTDFKPEQGGNVLFYYSHKITAPVRQAGEVFLIHETIDQVKEPRLAWIYSSGQRRVRRAPDSAYDAVGPSTAGLRTSDSRDMYNGAPDRYDWKLVGKKELYIPYNSYRLASSALKYNDILLPGHINQDQTRYELHRVWEVIATLKPNARHIYSKRHYFIDEDSWAIAEADHYDNRGELWRVGEEHAYYRYDVQVPLTAAEVFYDLQSGRYIASGLTNEQRKAYDFNYKASTSDYTPGALRSSGVR